MYFISYIANSYIVASSSWEYLDKIKLFCKSNSQVYTAVLMLNHCGGFCKNAAIRKSILDDYVNALYGILH